MFLNALVKHTEHRVLLARQLRAAFRAPKNVDVAQAQLADLIGVIAPPALPLDASQELDSAPEKPVVAPTHAVFFATMCWHLQVPDQWPAFQPSSRRVLHDEEELFTATGDPIHDYLLFRESFLSLGGVLSLTTWQLEHLCWWQSRQSPEADEPLFGFEEVPSRSRPKTRRALADTSASRLTQVEQSADMPLYRADRDSSPSRPGGRSARNDEFVGPDDRDARNDRVVRETPPPYVPFTEPPALDHTHVQWLLGKVGKQLGCRVWIAANDWRREWGGEPLGSLSVRALPPLGLSADSQRLVSLIDVVWLTGVNQVAAAFEVEHTTSVYSGLLRMADLAALSPNLSFPLYVVAPASRLGKVRRELLRPTFRALGLDRRCRFFSGEALLKALPNLARWATGPDAIEKLTESAAPND